MSKLMNAKKEICKLRNQRQRPMKIQPERPLIMNVGSEEMPGITIEKVKIVVTKLKIRKSTGHEYFFMSTREYEFCLL